MQNFLGRCLALALVGGGFTVTGDLGWLARRGVGVLSATGVPGAAAKEDEAAPIPAPSGTAAAQASALTRPPAAARGLDRVEILDLRPGDRLRVWVAADAAPAALFVLDIVDPVSGAAILHRGGGERVRLGGAIRRGGALEFVPLGLAYADAPPAHETLEPIVALDVAR